MFLMLEKQQIKKSPRKNSPLLATRLGQDYNMQLSMLML
tara:strand:+ start:335 stop:451 length:117 start_codon:yes stop_codon:yes gene_type:complete